MDQQRNYSDWEMVKRGFVAWVPARELINCEDEYVEWMDAADPSEHCYLELGYVDGYGSLECARLIQRIIAPDTAQIISRIMDTTPSDGP